MDIQNFTITPAPTADVTSLPRWTVSGELYEDKGNGGALIRAGSFNFPDILRNLTPAQRQELMEMVAIRIVHMLAGR
jgi:hypothetical protein